MKIADKFLREGKEYISKGDPVQASEKLYKAVEECLKFLAEKEGIPEYEEALREGRWWLRLLARASASLTTKLQRREIGEAWAKAYNLHVWGFHERTLNIEHIKPDIAYIEWLVNYTKEALKKEK